ncbi:unnamed protein product [Adineta steineri]|uniref:PDZ domain-containing protein n=1 Tax=Adineta steineri TaxID=433720 RepID=A0A815B532_9BILA|nr:unnamed protein product [Adineta steineri]CAF1554745.1 unnamed protein product [Adineta steineri]
MVKVFISKLDNNTAWGFRLQGGFEHGTPLTLTNIIPNSPGDGKIDPGDVLLEIAGHNATCMTHKDALKLIQHCGNALFLTIKKTDHSYSSNSTQLRSSSEYNHDRLPTPTRNIPQAPIFNADLIYNATASSELRKPINNTHVSHDQATNISTILAKMLDHPVGQKPFTYIPKGLDLSKMRDSSHIKRQYKSRSTSKDIQDFDQIMNRRMIVPPEQISQHHYAGSNPIQPFRYTRQQPVPPKKLIQHDTDVITHTRSFQMLEGWISDSEKTTPTVISTNQSAVAQPALDQKSSVDRRASAGSGASAHPSRSFRYLQEQYNDDDVDNNSPVPKTQESIDKSGLRRSSDMTNTPSRSFKYLQNQYDTSKQLPINRSEEVNNRDDLAEIYNKPPPSFRAREPEAKRFSGATNPSRAFRFLQMMTQEDQQTSPTSVPGYTKPQQLLEKHNEHPSQSTTNQTKNRINTLSNGMNSLDINESDY